MKTKPSIKKMLAANSALMGLMVLSPNAMSEDSFYEAVSGGKVKFDARLRYESSEQDNDNTDAKALTLRTRLGYETADFMKTTGYVEFSHVTVLGGVDSYSPQNTGYSIIADPEQTRLNQAYLKTSPVEGLSATAGRQRIILDNARFVGNVGWRQTEQVYDALRVEYAKAGFKADVSYLWDIHGIVGVFDREAQDILANFSYSMKPGKITAYHYHNKNDSSTGQIDLATTGLRFAGKTAFDEASINYQLEYAMQENDINKKEADYMHAVFGAGYKTYGLAVGYEVLGSDDGEYGFSTPLATKHAYNGWADMFLGTPATGLEDMYVKATAGILGVKTALVYHTYSSTEGSTDYGSEVNLVVVKPFAKKYKVGFKYADFSSDYAMKDDTTKMWAFAEMKF